MMYSLNQSDYALNTHEIDYLWKLDNLYEDFGRDYFSNKNANEYKY